MNKHLTVVDFIRAAKRLRVEVATILAVCRVEAPRGGFNPDGSVSTLFEGHKFYKYTKGAYADSHPTLCFRSWTRAHYGKTWQQEQERLRQAMTLNRTAALMSASWGRFQIMGFNFGLVGFLSVEDFVQAMQESEGRQLDAFCEYVIHTRLDVALRAKRWADFAVGYNGADFRINRYDEKLALAYEEAAKA